MKKVYLTWQGFGMGANILAFNIKQSKLKFDGIYGVPRGGLALAVVLSHSLNLPMLLHPTKNTLIVDDISDTGKTLQSFKRNKIATLFNTKWTITKPTWHVWEKESKKHWIVYPWEADE